MQPSSGTIIITAVALIIFVVGFHFWINRMSERTKQLRAQAPICPTCGEFADSSRLRAALCQDPCHREATDQRVRRLQGKE